MSYDDINDSFEPDAQGEATRIEFEDGRVFEGVCKDAKPWSGVMSFPNASGKTLSCSLEQGEYLNGFVPEKNGKVSFYQNGSKAEYKGLEDNRVANKTILAISLAVLAAGTVLVKPGESDTEVKISVEAKTPEVTKHNYYSKDTPHYMKTMPQEEFDSKYGMNLKNECNAEQVKRIDAARKWLLRNIGQIGKELSDWYFKPQNAPFRQEIFFSLRFPQNLTPYVVELYLENISPRVYCPGKNEELLGATTMYRFEDPENRGEIVFYEGNFDFEDDCTLAATSLHEVLHVNAAWNHSEAGETDGYDWIHLAGEIAESLCIEQNQ